MGRNLSDHRDALNFDQHFGLRETGDRDRRARREIPGQYLAAQFGHARGVPRVDEKHRHGNEVGEFGAGLGERLLDIAERLPALRIKIAGERFAGIVNRAGVAGEPDDCATLGEDGRRIGACLRPRAAHE